MNGQVNSSAEAKPSSISATPIPKPDLRFLSNAKPYMEQSISSEDWNRRCNDILAANGGVYPSFWKELDGDGNGYASANGSLYDRLKKSWSKPADQP